MFGAQTRIKRSKFAIDERPIVHFEGCAAAFPYSIGYAQFLKDNYPLSGRVRFSGASSGALVAIAMALDIDLALPIYLAQRYQKIAEKRPFGLIGTWKKLLSSYYDQLLPDDADYHRLDNLLVRVTYTDITSATIDRFASKEDLIQCLLASQHIPFFLDFKPFAQFRGRKCIDSQWLGQAPEWPGSTVVTVAPNLGFTKTKGISFVEALTIKTESEVNSLLQRGYREAQRQQSHLDILNPQILPLAK